jgi:hypothetical protein
VRHPISPLARIWSALIRNIAAANAALQDADKDWTLVDFEDVYGEKDLKIILGSYAEIPAGIRPLLQGHVIHWVLTQAAIWTKCEEPHCAVLLDVDSYFYFFSENAQVGCHQRPPPFGGCRTHGTDRGLSTYVIALSGLTLHL